MAATGAKILEVSGAVKQEGVMALVAKLREFLKPENVRVSRPTKTNELRVSGLEDSVTPEEVVAAIARYASRRNTLQRGRARHSLDAVLIGGRKQGRRWQKVTGGLGVSKY